MADINTVRVGNVNFEIYAGDKSSRLLGIANIDLPELKSNTVEVSGAGILGKAEIPVLGHFDSSTLSLNWRTITSDLAELAMQKRVDLTCYGAMQNYEHSSGKMTVQQVKISVRGVPKTATFGSFKPAESTESKSEIEIIYLKVEIGGKKALELDKVNDIFNVNGTDYYSEVKKALGRGGK